MTTFTGALSGSAYSIYRGARLKEGALLGGCIGVIAHSGLKALTQFSFCMLSRRGGTDCTGSEMAKNSLLALPLIFVAASTAFAICRSIRH